MDLRQDSFWHIRVSDYRPVLDLLILLGKQQLGWGFSSSIHNCSRKRGSFLLSRLCRFVGVFLVAGGLVLSDATFHRPSLVLCPS